MSLDNQLRKHTSILTVFGSSEESVLLTMQPVELNSHLHGTADFRYVCKYWVKNRKSINR